MGLWYKSDNGQVTGSREASDIALLDNIPSGYTQQDGYSGSNAVEVYKKFASSHPDEEQKTDFARRLAAQFGR